MLLLGLVTGLLRQCSWHRIIEQGKNISFGSKTGDMHHLLLLELLKGGGGSMKTSEDPVKVTDNHDIR